MFYSIQYASPVGALTVASDEKALVGLWMAGQKYYGDTVPGPFMPGDDLPVLRAAARWLDAYFAGERPDPAALPLAPIGGAFRQLVWRRLLEIPYGEVASYGQIAKDAAQRLGRARMSSQAVGGAVGHNPISIIIPCHRVVGTSGSLTGYSGGISKKIALLKHEGANLATLFVPKQGTAL